MSTAPLRRIPTEDRMWLMASLADALTGTAPLQPVPPEGAPQPPRELPAGTAFVIHTSGSTGTPKFVALSAEAVRASAEATHEALGGAGQWLVTLPTHLIAGLQTLTRSVIAGTEPVFYEGTFKPARFIEHAERMEHERRYVSLVPVQLSRVLEHCEQDPAALQVMRRFTAVLVGGQAVPLELRARAHDLGINLVRTYGMTETAGGVVYDGVEIGDTRVRVRTGEVQLAGSTLALGYAGDDALTASRFIEDAGVRWFLTGDAGELLGGMLSVTGRLDRVVISGGVNVSLDEVERVVQAQPGWNEAAAVGIDDPEWGQRVALVTPDDAEAATVAARVKAVLGPAAEPVRVVALEALPRLANGKPDYSAIHRLIEG